MPPEGFQEMSLEVLQEIKSTGQSCNVCAKPCRVTCHRVHTETCVHAVIWASPAHAKRIDSLRHGNFPAALTVGRLLGC